MNPDERSIVSPDFLYLTTQFQKGLTKDIGELYDRYIEICGCSTIDDERWLSREDFLLFSLCVGLGHKDMTFSDIINQAIVKGGLEIAKFNSEIEKEFNIT